ncbi:MAG: hypothetical protein JWQ62_2756 [Lacunisphaera sp.]|nr:hypothetical protein [Lacunisphaera sp.]
MKSLRHLLAALAAVLFAASALAAGPVGSWKTIERAKGRTDILDLIKFELTDGRLLGTVEGIDRLKESFKNSEFQVSNVSFRDGVLRFNLTREAKIVAKKTLRHMDQAAAAATGEMEVESRISKYEAKLEGDTLTGTVERMAREGTVHKAEWSAARVK